MMAANVITLYRICWRNPPTPEDMMSNEALGRQLRDDTAELRRLWQGTSMFDSSSRARRLAKRNPWKGEAYIATIEFPLGRFPLEKTLSANHYTVWGNPHDMLKYVTHVEHV